MSHVNESCHKPERGGGLKGDAIEKSRSRVTVFINMSLDPIGGPQGVGGTVFCATYRSVSLSRSAMDHLCVGGGGEGRQEGSYLVVVALRGFRG